MATLGLDILLKLVKEKKLVENLADRELFNPEGAGFDLRVGALYETKGPGFLGVENRNTSPTEEVAAYSARHAQNVVIRSGAYYLVKTIESVNMPEDIEATVLPRTTLFRCGVILITAKVNPGYRGELTFGLYNAGPFDFTLEMGARIAHISFGEIEGGTRLYRGQWQGGRVSTEGEEKQL